MNYLRLNAFKAHRVLAIIILLFCLIPNLTIAQNPTIINDSLVVQQRVYAKEKLIVDQEAKFKEDIIVLGDARMKSDVRVDSTLRVDGTAKFLSNVKMENLPTINVLDLTNFEVVIKTETGQLKAINVGTFFLQGTAPNPPVSCQEVINGQIVNPGWFTGLNKVFIECPVINVGIGTANPEHKLHVVGVNYARNFLAGNSTATNAALFNGYSINNSQTLISLGVKIGSSPEDVRFSITNKGEIKATNIGDGPTLIINNGTGHAVVAYANDGTKILQLQNDGKLYSRGVIVNLSTWADYVFKPGYELKTLKETETYIIENGHLPGVPSEKEIKENGIDLGEMQRIQMEKIEEMYLHMIDMNKQILELKEEVSQLKEENSQLKK